MVGRDDVATNAQGPNQHLSSRRMFWRSASWSASRTGSQNPESEEHHLAIPTGNNHSGSNGPNRRFPAVPLTPRSQHNSKARACLPPLQPLSIARRSLDEWPMAGSDDIGEWPHPLTPSGNTTGGERLKLDLSSTQRNPDKSCGQVKRDKIAFFDKKCSKVAEHIYLGGDAVAKDKNILRQNGITHILNCVGFVCPEYFKSDFVYRTLWLQDSPSEDITSILYDVFDYFEDVREQSGRIFVHCCQGVSRSTSLVIAYLMWREGQSFDDAFQYVKSARGIADPNMGFACQLLQCQKRVHAFPLSPTSLLRMYKMSPHSPYDPLHLVPKLLNDPSPTSLDSRGAFIIQIPTAIYVWIGKRCEDIMERDARAAVSQIVRYEKVGAPVDVIREDKEPDCFWDAFVNMAGERGKRKVDAYNLDFEIFQKAIIGGFVPPLASSNNEDETRLPARESSWSSLKSKFMPSFEKKSSVSFSKTPLSRVYSDSMMIVHALSPSSSSSSSDNISEPSRRVLPPSAALPNLSNLSLYPSQTSSSESNSLESRGAGNSSRPRDELLPNKKISPSLAERRGNLSKSLKLPGLVDDSNKGTATAAHAICQPDSIEMIFNFDTNSKSRTIDSISQRDGHEHINCRSGRPLAYRWPSMEKITKLRKSDLDSKSVITFSLPSDVNGPTERVLHIWIGKLFSLDSNDSHLINSKIANAVEKIDWAQVGNDILTQMDLPKDTPVKIIREGEELTDFLALLCAL